jgi:CheY-like chemotaxis protein
MAMDGLRVLLIEDEGMIAMLAKGMLKSIGCEVVGVAARVPDALRKIDTISFDVALLDVNLAGSLSYAVAEALRARGKQFIFATGYGASSLPPEMHDVPVLSKPYVLSQLSAALSGMSVAAD